MTKLNRMFALAGAVALVSTSVALACTTKSATVIGRMSVAAAPAGSQCAASGATCSYFEVMSASNADGLALGDLTGKTMKAVMPAGIAMPASTPAGAILVAKADIDWDKGMINVASVEPASEPVATAAMASWEKSLTNAALAGAGSKSGCCASGARRRGDGELQGQLRRVDGRGDGRLEGQLRGEDRCGDRGLERKLRDEDGRGDRWLERKLRLEGECGDGELEG